MAPTPFLKLIRNGGTMTTAGNLVFFGDIQGIFHALDAKTGQQLWQMNVVSGVGAGPISLFGVILSRHVDHEPPGLNRSAMPHLDLPEKLETPEPRSQPVPQARA